MDIRLLLSFGLSIFILIRNIPGALLCLFPKLLRARFHQPNDGRIDEELFSAMENELSDLGFNRLGVHTEYAFLRKKLLVYDFVNLQEKTWASAYLKKKNPLLFLLTPFENNGFVLTADHSRISINRQGECLAGGMPGILPDKLNAAHRRRVESMLFNNSTPLSNLSLDARIKSANSWISSHGAREIRIRALNNLVLAAIGFFIFLATIFAFTSSKKMY